MSRLISVCLLFVMATLPVAGQQAAIRAKGIIESTETGFRFPDGTVQSTAATVTGGVPSVNGITGEVAIAGTGATSVSTSIGLIQIHTPVTPPVYTRTVIVSPYPGNDLTSGTRLIDALEAASSGSLKAATLIKVEPGRYDIGTAQLVMKPYVDIEGSGEGLTRIVTRRGGAATDAANAGIIAASNTELRELNVQTIASSGTVTMSIAAVDVTAFRVRDVTLHASGASNVIAIRTSGSEVGMDRVNVTASGGADTSIALYTLNSTVAIANSTLLGDGAGTGAEARAIHHGSGAVSVRGSTLLARGATTEIEVLYVNSGTGIVHHSTLEATDAATRRGVSTGSSGNAKLYHSLVTVGNEWVASGVRAAFRNMFSGPITFYASFVDSHSTTDFSPACIGSFWTSGTLQANCTKP